ncbi:MAG: peptidylprolyl isomerase [Candidatus Tectomicrobia bacterium]|nr:peptidylprolyl isomerase [Candidatus Tectomicrobia bacterium]
MLSILFLKIFLLILLFSFSQVFAAPQQPTQVHLRIIAVSSQEEADNIVVALRNGKDFPALAREYSRHSSQKRGGDIGPVSLKELAPNIREAIRSLREGEVSHVIKVENQYLLFQVTTDRFFESGHQFYKAEEYEKALRAFARDLELNPDNVNSYNLIGVMYSKAGFYEKAAEAYRKALEIEPGFTGAQDNLKTVLEKLEEEKKMATSETSKPEPLQPSGSQLTTTVSGASKPEPPQPSSSRPNTTISEAPTPKPEPPRKDEKLVIGIVSKGKTQSAERFIKVLREMKYTCTYLSKAELTSYSKFNPTRTTFYYREGTSDLTLEVARKVKGTQDVLKNPFSSNSRYPIVVLVADDILKLYPK